MCRNPIQFDSLSQKSTRIVGGSRAKFNWPFIVRIQISEYSFCGGTLLNNMWVVTSGQEWRRTVEKYGDLHKKDIYYENSST